MKKFQTWNDTKKKSRYIVEKTFPRQLCKDMVKINIWLLLSHCNLYFKIILVYSGDNICIMYKSLVQPITGLSFFNIVWNYESKSAQRPNWEKWSADGKIKRKENIRGKKTGKLFLSSKVETRTMDIKNWRKKRLQILWVCHNWNIVYRR